MFLGYGYKNINGDLKYCLFINFLDVGIIYKLSLIL